MVNDPNLDPTLNNPRMGEQFSHGAPVFDVNGEKVGDVSEHGIQQGQLVIHRGLLQKDVYLPLNSVVRNDVNGVTLNITKDEVKGLEGRGANPTDRQQGQQDANTGPWGDVGSTGAGLNTDRAGADQPAMGAAPMPPMSGTTGTTPARGANRAQGEDIAIPLSEEQLIVNRERNMQAGGNVRLHKDVVEEQRNITTPVTHEELRVEHSPAQGNIPVGKDAFTEKEMEVPLMGESVNVTKEARVADEVRLRKQPVTEEQQVTGTVRKERLHVDGIDQAGENLEAQGENFGDRGENRGPRRNNQKRPKP